jgi:hypothetical protein
VQYEHARHDCTAWIVARKDFKTGKPELAYQSPYWTSNNPSAATTGEPDYPLAPDGAERLKRPSPIADKADRSPADAYRRGDLARVGEKPTDQFTDFDYLTTECGLRHACAMFLPAWEGTFKASSAPNLSTVKLPIKFLAKDMPHAEILIPVTDNAARKAGFKVTDKRDMETFYTKDKIKALQMSAALLDTAVAEQKSRWQDVKL